jgi:hypothetical protein
MSHAMTKPTEWVCNQHGSRPACASVQSDQDPCCLFVCFFHFTSFSNSISVTKAGGFLTIVPGELPEQQISFKSELGITPSFPLELGIGSI